MNMLDLIEKIEDLEKTITNLTSDLENGEYNNGSCPCESGECYCVDSAVEAADEVARDVATDVARDMAYEVSRDFYSDLESRLADLEGRVEEVENNQ